MKELWHGLTPANARRIVVKWRDIRDTSSWEKEDDDIRPARQLETLGWLLYEGVDPSDSDCEILVIARTYDWEEKRWSEFTVFPKTVWRGIE